MNISDIANNPQFSIICSIRSNYACFFDELLTHILGQSNSNYECIFIIDEDNLDWIELPDERFKLIRLEKELSLAKKRNIGIEKSIGEYIIFCDADDYLDKNILNLFSSIVEQFKPDFIIPRTSRNPEELLSQGCHQVKDACFISDRERLINIFFSRYLCNYKSDIGVNILDGCWGRAFKRDIIERNKIRFLEEPCRAEDALFVNDFIQCCQNAYFIKDYYGYYWRINNNSEMFNVNSFFYNIEPFAEKLSNQMKMVPKEYSKDLYLYIGSLVASQFGVFCTARKKKQIDRNTFNKLLKKTVPHNSFCEKAVKEIDLKYGIKYKMLFSFYFLKMYFLIYLFFNIRNVLAKRRV